MQHVLAERSIFSVRQPVLEPQMSSHSSWCRIQNRRLADRWFCSCASKPGEWVMLRHELDIPASSADDRHGTNRTPWRSTVQQVITRTRTNAARQLPERGVNDGYRSVMECLSHKEMDSKIRRHSKHGSKRHSWHYPALHRKRAESPKHRGRLDGWLASLEALQEVSDLMNRTCARNRSADQAPPIAHVRLITVGYVDAAPQPPRTIDSSR